MFVCEHITFKTKREELFSMIQADTHPNVKNLAVTKAECIVALLLTGPKRQKPTAAICICTRGNDFPYSQVAVVCIRHSKVEI